MIFQAIEFLQVEDPKLEMNRKPAIFQELNGAPEELRRPGQRTRRLADTSNGNGRWVPCTIGILMGLTGFCNHISSFAKTRVLDYRIGIIFPLTTTPGEPAGESYLDHIFETSHFYYSMTEEPPVPKGAEFVYCVCSLSGLPEEAHEPG